MPSHPRGDGRTDAAVHEEQAVDLDGDRQLTKPAAVLALPSEAWRISTKPSGIWLINSMRSLADRAIVFR
jgi:hypothetical protein